VRADRGIGDWLSTKTHFAATRARLHLVHRWDAMGEYRWLWIDETQETKQGALVGLCRHLGDNLKFGVGYNFTDFSDDLTDLSYDSHGWFVSALGKF
jgi:hypothetical protein